MSCRSPRQLGLPVSEQCLVLPFLRFFFSALPRKNLKLTKDFCPLPNPLDPWQKQILWSSKMVTDQKAHRSSKWHYRQRKHIFELIMHFTADTDTD